MPSYQSLVSLVTCLSCRGEDNEGGKRKEFGRGRMFLVAFKSKHHYFLDYNKICLYNLYAWINKNENINREQKYIAYWLSWQQNELF